MRCVIPISAGLLSGFGWWATQRTSQVAPRALAEVVISEVSLLSSGFESFGLASFVQGLWQLTGLVLAWEFRAELRVVLTYSLHILVFLLHCIYSLVWWFHSSSWEWLQVRSLSHSVGVLSRTERGSNLTCMAAQVVPAGGGGGPPFASGSFIIVSRGAEWDEVWIAGYTNSGEAIVRTTDDSGDDWIWALVKLVPLQVKGEGCVGRCAIGSTFLEIAIMFGFQMRWRPFP